MMETEYITLQPDPKPKKCQLKINLVHPSRGRPEMALECSRKWRDRALNPNRIQEILSLDYDDETKSEYKNSKEFSDCIRLINANKGMVEATNRAMPYLLPGLTITMYDDFEPMAHWDEVLIRLIRKWAGSAIFVDCGSNIQTVQIADTSVFLRWGYILYPGYYSMYSDNDYTEHCGSEKIIIDARFCTNFIHNHPIFEGVPRDQWDDTYRRSNTDENYEQGRLILEDRRKNNYGNLPN